MSSSFVNKIKYKKERVGVVEKGGKTYVKYVKARRFKLSKDIKYGILSVFILLFFCVGIKLLLSELASRPTPEAPLEGIGE